MLRVGTLVSFSRRILGKICQSFGYTIMADVKALVRELAEYALAKKGVILTLGGSSDEPNLGGRAPTPLKLTDAELDRLLELESDFRFIQNCHWLSRPDPLHIH